MSAPDPTNPYPLAAHPRVGLLRPLVDHPLIEIGEFTYYDDPDGPERFVERCVLYHYEFTGDRLVIGRYCAIAAAATFIMNGANHALGGFSTFPFAIFPGDWQERFDPKALEDGNRGDTIVGNDVWIGTRATIMPGVTIGDGAIIGAHAVVGADVPPYAVAVGNPARVVRMRFDAETVARLLDVAWWNWPVDNVTRNLDAITGADIDRLEAAA
jgi:virginiamycin A acetyltransferase